MSTFTKAEVEQGEPPVYCTECAESVYTCDDCQEYFDPDNGEEIVCETRGTLQTHKHYCSTCGADKMEQNRIKQEEEKP